MGEGWGEEELGVQQEEAAEVLETWPAEDTQGEQQGRQQEEPGPEEEVFKANGVGRPVAGQNVHSGQQVKAAGGQFSRVTAAVVERKCPHVGPHIP